MWWVRLNLEHHSKAETELCICSPTLNSILTTEKPFTVIHQASRYAPLKPQLMHWWKLMESDNFHCLVDKPHALNKLHVWLFIIENSFVSFLMQLKFCFIMLKSTPLICTTQKQFACNYVYHVDSRHLSVPPCSVETKASIDRLNSVGEIMTGPNQTHVPCWQGDPFLVEAVAQVWGEQFDINFCCCLIHGKPTVSTPSVHTFLTQTRICVHAHPCVPCTTASVSGYPEWLSWWFLCTV